MTSITCGMALLFNATTELASTLSISTMSYALTLTRKFYNLNFARKSPDEINSSMTDDCELQKYFHKE